MARPERRDDATLARAAGAGDRDALEALLERHLDRVHAICRRILGHPEDARDAAQEALISVARSIGRFDGRSAFTTWLYRVATNAALDEARRRARRPVPSESAGDAPARGPGPDSVVDRLDLDAALGTIPIEFRTAVVLRDLCDLDYAQISEVLDIPPGTVRSRIARGRAALALELTGNRAAAVERPTEQP